MQLHELKWHRSLNHMPYAIIPLIGTHIDIRRSSPTTYSIYLEKGLEVRHWGGLALERWANLNEFEAQCVIHHLMQQYGVITSEVTDAR